MCSRRGIVVFSENEGYSTRVKQGDILVVCQPYGVDQTENTTV